MLKKHIEKAINFSIFWIQSKNKHTNFRNFLKCKMFCKFMDYYIENINIINLTYKYFVFTYTYV